VVIHAASDCFYSGTCGRRDSEVATVLLFIFISSGVTVMRLDRWRLRAKGHLIGEGRDLDCLY
jgi:hypothetical protein